MEVSAGGKGTGLWPFPPVLLPAGTVMSRNQASLLPSLPSGLSADGTVHTLFPILRIKEMQSNFSARRAYYCNAFICLEDVILCLFLCFFLSALLHLPGDTFLLMFRNFPVPFVWLQFFLG